MSISACIRQLFNRRPFGILNAIDYHERTDIMLCSLRLLGIALLACCCFAASARAEDEFSSRTIDLGVVVSDLDAAVKFYTEGIGFTEQEGFAVPADFAANVGLTDSKPLKISVLTLGEGDGATKLKLMQLPGVKSKKSDNAFIHSELGVSYITIWITDTNKALARLKKVGAKPIAKSPVELPKGFPEGIFLTIVRDPDGNLIELVGPKK